MNGRYRAIEMESIVDQISFGGIVAIRDSLLKRQSEGGKVYRLESGDPSFDIPPHVRDAMIDALMKGYTHYTESTGIRPLREAAYQKVVEENKIPLKDPNHVLITNGAMHALYVTFRALLIPGDEVIIPDPMWTEIADNVRLAGGIPVRCRLKPENNFVYDPSDVESLITSKTKAIFINTPHNPTGAVFPKNILEEIGEIAIKKNLYIVSDEAYEHIIYDGLKHVSIGSLPGVEDRTISIFSASKSFAMSGLRIGYIATNIDKIIERGKKLLRCTINGVNSIAQYGALAALRGPKDYIEEMRREYQLRRDMIYDTTSKLKSLKPFKPRGAFYIWCKISEDWRDSEGKRSDWAMTNYLLKFGLGSTPGSEFGPASSEYIRFSFSCATSHLAESLEMLKKVLE
ncbi:MAG: pyridoxal phosphate-dependent aminotransferase [Aigarchaeota archaeon]|nr:pyridoxal phosphate-dependent aminotransferase [Aigarchaeota archaeon]MDW7986152.1 pyridoxal phosphate-dependent aminotransferase [Nitrososphaerota archaeon]